MSASGLEDGEGVRVSRGLGEFERRLSAVPFGVSDGDSGRSWCVRGCGW